MQGPRHILSFLTDNISFKLSATSSTYSCMLLTFLVWKDMFKDAPMLNSQYGEHKDQCLYDV